MLLCVISNLTLRNIIPIFQAAIDFWSANLTHGNILRDQNFKNGVLKREGAKLESKF